MMRMRNKNMEIQVEDQSQPTYSWLIQILFQPSTRHFLLSSCRSSSSIHPTLPCLPDISVTSAGSVEINLLLVQGGRSKLRQATSFISWQSLTLYQIEEDATNEASQPFHEAFPRAVPYITIYIYTITTEMWRSQKRSEAEMSLSSIHV